MKKMFFALVFLCLNVNADTFTRKVVSQCTLQEVGGLAIQTLKTHLVKTLVNGGSKVDPNKFQVKYLGLRPIFDTKNVARPQHAFQLTVTAEDKTPIVFATPTEILEGSKTTYSTMLNGYVVAIANPEVVVTRDQLGNVVSKSCVVKSHAGLNRHLAYVNASNGYVFNTDLISFELPILANVQMK